MTPGLGSMAPALACFASAVLVMPPPAAHRRFQGLFRRVGRARKMHSKWMIRAAPLLAASLVLLTGPGPAIAAVLVTATLAARRRRAHRDRLRAADSAQLLEGLESVIGELRIGAHPSAAAQVAARETTGEVARAFAVSAARSRLGGSGAEGLRRPGTVVAGELSRVAAAWQVAERHGLALAELLTAARLDLLGRKRFRDRTRAALAGARATAAVLALLPVLGIGLGELMGASPLHVLFRSAAGTVLLPLGSALTCAGLLWADAITDKVLR
ncbi:type II secretion system F family protein [Nocardia concava]|uniref:type II secretion system F family protein n=1 Tax=Nocardia concava TaxID=257281 RepID=UPI001FE0890E|nr:type II secretion system F family protein [Nocardia concava]